jgi:PKD repeat protein
MRPKLSNRGAAVLIWGALAMAVVTAGAPEGQAQMAYVNVSPNYSCPPPCLDISCDASYYPPCDDPSYYNIVTPFGQSDGLNDFELTWSADATKVAFTRNGDIFVADAAVANPLGITNTGNNYSPAWSPDGARIAFASTRDTSHLELYLMKPDGSGVVRLTYNVALNSSNPAWSPDGRRIAFNCEVDSGNFDICAINPDGTGFVRLTTDPAQDSGPTWSPDGASIAFATGRYNPSSSEIAVMNPDGSGVAQVGTGVFGWNPAWSPDGAQIAFDGYGSGYLYPVAIYTMKADGTNVALFANSAFEPAWMPARVPVAAFRFACTGTTCNFDASGSKDSYGTITSYAWSFGDQATGTGASVTHTYAKGGAYTAKLTVTDTNGATGTKFEIIPLNPVAAFTFSCSALMCNFDASGSKDSNGTITSYDWNFGDGGTGAGLTISHTYAVGNTYNVALTVTDSIGGTGTQSKTVVANSPPVASFTFTCNQLTCSFNGSGSRDSDGTIGSYVWNFGDGTTSSGLTVSHTYAAGGQYTVTLTVTDNLGSSNTQSQTVVPNSPPVASFTFSCSKFTCSFDGSASKDNDGTITSYAWKFGDGTTGSGPAVSHTYKAPPDTYTVTLTVTDNRGATGAQSTNITVIHRK